MRHFFISGALVLVSSASLFTPVIAGELEGSAWRLLNIASMDDTVYAPDDSANYTLPPVVAIVLGEEIRSNDASERQSAILTLLFDRYAAERGIKVEEAELNAYIENMRRGMAAEGLTADADISAEEKLQVDTMRREMGTALIRHWKINKSLYESYGGRIIYQQFGPEPLDAYRQYLQERQKVGDFRISEPAMAAAFWQYFTDESKHDFMAKGSADAAKAFVTPPWEQQGY